MFKTPLQLVGDCALTVEEAYHIFVESSYCDGIDRIFSLYKELFQMVQKEMEIKEYKWIFASAICAVWNTGRIEGIRQERKRRAGRR